MHLTGLPSENKTTKEMTQLTIDNFKTMLATALSNIKAREDEFS